MLGSKFNRQTSLLIQKSIQLSLPKKTLPRTLVTSILKTPSVTVPATFTRFITTTKFVSQSETSSGGGGSDNLFHVEDRRTEGYVILKLNKGPVNSLNLDFLTALNIQLEKFEQAADVKGVIITSNVANIFSAGLDILEMYDSKPDRIRQFWSALQDFWINVYGSNKIYIAAINGHAPAGGCLMAITCDYRVMAKGNFKIGLNETLLGITAPFWFKDTLVNTIGHRESELALQLGKLYSAEEALRIKLVDELAEPKDVLLRAQEQMAIWCKIPEHARALTKSSMRQETISYLQSQKSDDIEHFANFIVKESIQKSLGAYLASLKKPKKPKA